MKSEFIQLNKNDHANLKIKPGLDVTLLEKQNIVPVILPEVPLAITDLPVAFVKYEGEEGDAYRFVALLGTKADESLYIKDGKPRGTYVPFYFSHQPLGIVVDPNNSEKFMILVDKHSSLLSESEGVSLFDSEGNDSEMLTNRAKAMANYFRGNELTEQFVSKVAELELLTPRSLSFEVNGEKKSVGGLYVIDEKKLNELSDEQFIELRKNGYLAAIYSHLISLNQFRRLVQWTNEEAANG